MTMRALPGAVLAVALLAGSAQWRQTPYNAREACEGAGGTLTSGGECQAGLE
jgi:hypothetical protein